MFVKDGEKCWFVKLENVRLFESEGNYGTLYITDGTNILMNGLITKHSSGQIGSIL